MVEMLNSARTLPTVGFPHKNLEKYPPHVHSQTTSKYAGAGDVPTFSCIVHHLSSSLYINTPY